MNRSYRTIYVLVALNTIIAAVFLFLMPDQVPAHFGMNGEPNRIGSKYESLIIPTLAVVFGVALVFTAKRCDEQERKALIKGNIILQLCMMAFIIWSSLTALSYGENTPQSASFFNTAKGAATLGGIFFIVAGNFMPKMKVNALFGIRTPWSMSNDEVWRKTQRFGGAASIITGALLLLCAWTFAPQSVTPMVLGIILVNFVACLAASYYFYKTTPCDPKSSE